MTAVCQTETPHFSRRMNWALSTCGNGGAGMPTVCLRGGCLTGPNQTGVEPHGFLSYLVKCNIERKIYTVCGYKGKQVRDNIRSHESISGVPASHEYVEASRAGDHIRYISDISKARAHYPGWDITTGLTGIFTGICEAWARRA